MDRVAIFIDAGYLFAQATVTLLGEKAPRSALALDIPAAVTFIEEFASEVSGLPVLRTYWYDGTSSGPSAQHEALAHSAGVKVRLGIVNAYGQQKGVDSLVVTDMINLARNRAMTDAVLVTGDEDLRVGVQQAQEFGVRVHLVGVKPARLSQSNLLLQEADTCHEWADRDLQRFLRPSVTALTPDDIATEGVTEAEVLVSVAEAIARSLDETVLSTLSRTFATGEWRIPRDVDGPLLRTAESKLSRSMVFEEKKALRAAFKAAVLQGSE